MTPSLPAPERMQVDTLQFLERHARAADVRAECRRRLDRMHALCRRPSPAELRDTDAATGRLIVAEFPCRPAPLPFFPKDPSP